MSFIIAKKKVTADGSFHKANTRTFEIFAQNIYQKSPHDTKRNYKPIIVNTPMLVIKVIPIYLLSFCFVKFVCLLVCLLVFPTKFLRSRLCN